MTLHPHKEAIYEIVFKELGLDILRLRNEFRYGEGLPEESAEIVEKANASLGRQVTILMSSWSPPAALKANGAEDCKGKLDCTLIRVDGQFAYEQFAAYWHDALQAYAAIGIVPDYISIQNEPDYIPVEHQGCFFAPEETPEYPGYARAVDTLRERLATTPDPPAILGPETAFADERAFRYLDALKPHQVSGIAHHLYAEPPASAHAPDDLIGFLQRIKDAAGRGGVFQTEFSSGTSAESPLETAWLIHNSLVEGNAVAYLYWELVWYDRGLVLIEIPGLPDTWSSPKGYIIRDPYYAVRHFSRFTDPGFVRVGAKSSDKSVRVSAFESPDAKRLVVIALNVGSETHELRFDRAGVGPGQTNVYLSTFQSSPAQGWIKAGPLRAGGSFRLPSRSIITVTIDR